MVCFEDLLKGKCIDFDALIDYGFVKSGDSYIYNKLLNDDLKLIVQVTSDFKVGARVIDNETKEVYGVLNNLKANGSYIRDIRSLYDFILGDIAVKCFYNPDEVRVSPKIPGQTKSGDMMLFSSQMEALEAELLRLNSIEANNGDLSEYEENRKSEIEHILANAVVSLDNISTDMVGYGTGFSASIDGRGSRKFILVYANTAVLKATDGAMFLSQDTVFGKAVLGKSKKEEFAFINQSGIESHCVITDIYGDEYQFAGSSSHGAKIK